MIGTFSIAMMLSMAPPPPVFVVPGPAPKNSGNFECRLNRDGDVKVRISGELGVAPADEKGPLRGRVRLRSEEAPELAGTYVAEWKGSYFSFWRAGVGLVSMHFHYDEIEGTGAALVRGSGDPTARGTDWYAGLCSHSLSHKEGAVIR